MTELGVLGMAAGEAFVLAAIVLWRAAPDARSAPEPPEPAQTAFVTTELTPAQRRLAHAGFGAGRGIVAVFALARFALGALGAAAGIAALRAIGWSISANAGEALGFAALGFCLGYLAPSIWIDKRQGAYKRRIERGLPDSLDLLQICMEAGQSLDQSVIRAAKELAPVHPDLARHLDWAAEAIVAGMDRGEAFRRVASETENDDIAALGAALVQAQRMGTPMAQTIAVYADDLRDKRLRLVEGRANVLPTKMTLGTMTFTVPPLLLLLLTPAILRIMGML